IVVEKVFIYFFFFQAEDGIRDRNVTGVQTCALPIYLKTTEQHTEGAILFEQSQNAPIQRHVLPEGAVERSVRLFGGIGSLIDAIASTLPQDTVELKTSVTAIRMEEEGTLTLEADLADGKKKSIRAGAVILALPPRIVAQR